MVLSCLARDGWTQMEMQVCSRIPRVVVLRETEFRREFIGDLLQRLATSLGNAEVVEEHRRLRKHT